ncbi:cysteine proteinase inhibitor 12-like [Panicum virgatum]|uniref:cysteine proteinase inhibitor 12-like n=1 Tax=Panicum virgatum TaxID=38727 RepID=UPI0019D625A6|nr:cysteine proteinase inhibitor 12-like [Panicum virgatum]
MAVTDGLDRVAWLASVAGLAEEAQLGWASGTVGCLACSGKFGLPFFEQASLPLVHTRKPCKLLTDGIFLVPATPAASLKLPNPGCDLPPIRRVGNTTQPSDRWLRRPVLFLGPCPPRHRIVAPGATMSAERDELRAAAEGMLVLLCGRIVDAPGRENDPRIVDLARSAVDEQNKNVNTHLEFEKLVTVKEQGVAGTLYYFTIKAKDGDAKKLYEAKVYEAPWLGLEGLVDLKLC